ncbi:TPR end-of-group domain-containing protein [Acanthopleuribacter pedis]|uniref:Tetratricopeptide repeat protein n=1 Tax=Acanthopleuribacter pedis TaxID=442870 RepID=A0A8J7QPU6_9BACT|nr:hypothetical protein [Acanthopleuribacter pedis]MBO1322463.1 hypothetical protein [Acanthopleuribacter pedis]
MEDLNFGLLGALENQREQFRQQLNERLAESLTPSHREPRHPVKPHLRGAAIAAVFESGEDAEHLTLSALRRIAEEAEPAERVVLVDLYFFAFLHGCEDALAAMLDIAECGEPRVEAESAMVLALLLANEDAVKKLNARPKTAARVRRFIAQDDVFAWFSLTDQALNGLVLSEVGLLCDTALRLEDPEEQAFHWLKPYSPGEGRAYPLRQEHPILRRLLPMLDECYGLSPVEKYMLDALAAEDPVKVESVISQLTRAEAAVTLPFCFERIRLCERLFALFQFCRVFSLERAVDHLVARGRGFQKKLDRWVERPSVKTLFIARRASAEMINALRDMDHHRAEDAAQAAAEAYADVAQEDGLSENDRIAWFQAVSTAAQATEDADEAFRLVVQSLEMLENIAPFFPAYPAFFYLWGFTHSSAAEWAEHPEEARRRRREALAKYEWCLELAPDDASALFGIAYEYGEDAVLAEEPAEQRALRRAAIEKYREALAVKPRMGNAHYNWGNELFQLARLAEEPEEAAQLFQEAARHYGECAEIRQRDVDSLEKCAGQLAAVARELSDPTEQARYMQQAISLLDNLLTLDPDRPDVALMLGHHWDDLAEAAKRDDICRGYREQAVQRYLDATVLDPDEERAFFHLGYQKSCLAGLYPDVERIGTLRRQAIEHYQRALELNPDMHLVHYNCAYEHEQLSTLTKDSDERERLRLAALIEFEMYVRMEPDAGSGHFKLAYHLDESAFTLDDPVACRETLDRAVYHYKQALASAPEDDTTWYYLGLTWLRLADAGDDPGKTRHRLGEARQAFEKTLSLDGQRHGAQVGMACVFAGLAKLGGETRLQIENHRRAASHYQAALALKPEEAEDWFQLGFQTESIARLTEAHAGRRTALLEALGYYKKALGFQPGKIAALYQWGCSLAELAEICVDPGQKQAYHHAAAGKFRGVYQLNPAATNALTDWGHQLHRLAALQNDGDAALERHKQALAVFQRVLKQEPTDPFAAYNVGVQLCYTAFHDQTNRREALDQAVALFRKSLEAPLRPARIPYVGMAGRLNHLAELLGDPAFDSALAEIIERLFEKAEALAEPGDRTLFHHAVVLSKQAKRAANQKQRRTLRARAISLFEAQTAATPADIACLESLADEHNRQAEVAETGEQRREHLETALGALKRAFDQVSARADVVYRVAEQLGRLASAVDNPIQVREYRQAAVSYYHKALAQDRQHLPSLINLGAELAALADATHHVDRRREYHLQAVSTLKRAAAAGSRHHLIYTTLAHQLTHLAFLAEQPQQANTLLTEAADNYKQITQAQPDNYAAWRNWGYLLDQMAANTSDPERQRRLWGEALTKYERGLQADVAPYQALVNHGLQCELKAKCNDDPVQKRDLLQNAQTYYRKARLLNPHHKELLSMALNCSKKLLKMASDADQERILADEAEAIIHELSSLTGIPINRNYNYACVLALSGKRSEALTVLERCLSERAVLPRQVAQDPDWTGLHDEPEFTRLMERFV